LQGADGKRLDQPERSVDRRHVEHAGVFVGLLQLGLVQVFDVGLEVDGGAGRRRLDVESVSVAARRAPLAPIHGIGRCASENDVTLFHLCLHRKRLADEVIPGRFQ